MKRCVAPELITTIKKSSDARLDLAALSLLQTDSEQSGSTTTKAEVGVTLPVEVPLDFSAKYENNNTHHDVYSVLKRNDYSLNTSESMEYLFHGMSPEALEAVKKCLGE